MSKNHEQEIPAVALAYSYRAAKGLSKKIVEEISAQKNEPGWMTDFRLEALEIYQSMPLPTWGADLSELNDKDITYYLKPLEDQKRSWDEVPETIKDTFEKLGVPQAERQFLAGVGAQFDSEVIYKNLKQEWADRGVIFTDIHTGLNEHPDIFKKYFSTVIPSNDNKFAALNSAAWSGGSFVYVPAGVHVDMPLQAYFRINASSMGQFERTLIIAEAGAQVHYVEGCSAPLYSASSLHAAVVEVIAHSRAQVQYTTIQNWATNVYNLVTKRAIAHADAKVIWVDGNFGSKITMKYPCVILQEPGAKAEIFSLAVADAGQHQDAGAKVIHLAPRTSSSIIAKSMSKLGGRSSYRGLVKVVPGAHEARVRVRCDALLLDGHSRADTYPTMNIAQSDTDIGHEASVSKVNDEQLVYLMSRGLTEAQASTMIVTGFIDPFVKLLPMEYAVEINALIAHHMEGSIG